MSDLHLIAHNIRSRENVGSLFRTCDSLGVKKLWLTGYTAAPPDLKISKVALGAEKIVRFEHVSDVHLLMEKFKREHIPVYALELTMSAVDLTEFHPPEKMALLLGTERTGILPSLIEVCDGVIKISQKGMKESLNVSTAAAIAAWAILNSRESH